MMSDEYIECYLCPAEAVQILQVLNVWRETFAPICEEHYQKFYFNHFNPQNNG